MSSTSPTAPIVAQIKEDVQQLIGYVTGPESQSATAYAVERTLFRQLLRLGAALLRLFFLSRAEAEPLGAVTSPSGTRLRFHDRRPTTYFSVFGKVTFDRRAYTAPGESVVCPLDAALSLPPHCYSDLLREWAGFGVIDAAFRAVQLALQRILGQTLSVQALETAVAADAADVAAFYREPPGGPAPAPAATILVAQADGKGVPLVRTGTARPRPVRRGKGQPPGTKKEAIVTSVYTIAPYRRTPEDVREALLPETTADPAAGTAPPTSPRAGPTPPARPVPQRKEVRATLAGKEVALARLAERVAQHDGPAIQERVALSDGAEPIQRAFQTHLPGHTLVLDIIHALEHLWEAANARLGERDPDRTAWVRTRLDQLLQGDVAVVIADLTTAAQDAALTAVQRKVLEQTAAYYERNREYLRYDEYLAKGWPIGTGVVEGACGHLVKDRLEGAGMRWTVPGAEAVLDLRAVQLNDHWDAYWAWHRAQQHARLYGSPSATPPPSELDVLDLPWAA